MVFTSSLGHVFASAILFVFLTIALVAAQFRKRRATFTFVNIAAALADFDAPPKCVEMIQSKAASTVSLAPQSYARGPFSYLYHVTADCHMYRKFSFPSDHRTLLSCILSL